MKRRIAKWTFRLTVTGFFIIGLLLIIVLNPMLTYAHKGTHNNYTVYYNQQLSPSLLPRLDSANSLLQASEFYNPNLHLDICLNDGSHYPSLIRLLRGPAFAWGFYNKVVLQGTMQADSNTVTLNGYKWNLTQLLAHEMVHCLQFNHLGLLHANPIANIPNWKWEGYAEYIARQNPDQRNLTTNITRLLKTNKDEWAVIFCDSTIAPKDYYNYWLLTQYSMDIKRLTYQQLLADTTDEEATHRSMMQWYSQNATTAVYRQR